MKENGLGCLPMVLLFAGGMWAYHQYAASDDLTVYFRSCTGRADTLYDCAKLPGTAVFLNSKTFKVDIEKQRVFELGELTGVIRYESCRMADRSNWICDYNDKSGFVQVANGRYEQTFGAPGTYSIQQVSWIDYMMNVK